MTPTQYEESFKNLYNLFTEIYLTFHTWKGLQDSTYNAVFKENINFWNAVLFSLQRSWLTILANVYEESIYSKNATVISVYALIPYQKDIQKRNAAVALLKNHSKEIKAIQVLRKNQLAHNNADYLLNPKKIQAEFPITYEEVEGLLNITSQLLSSLNPQNDRHKYFYENFAEEFA